MQEIKKTAIFAVVGSSLLTFANLVIYHNALLHESQYLHAIKGATHTHGEQSSDYIGYKSRY